MASNPFSRPGKHFVPKAQFDKLPAHKGNWNLVDDRGSIVLYNKPYAVCAAGKKDYGRKRTYSNTIFKIVPCLK